jgi:hypothetical protein
MRTESTPEPRLARPLSPAHCAMNTDDPWIVQLVVKLPPFAPAVTV